LERSHHLDIRGSVHLYTELEEPVADLRPFWFGVENLHFTRLQQAATDFRAVPAADQ
jgi:hypothetical protein